MSLATDTIYRSPFKSKCYTLQRLRRSYIVVICKNKSYITFVIDHPLMMAQSRAESTRDTYNYGQYLDQFQPNTIKAIRQYERIQKKICRQKMSIMFNKICISIYKFSIQIRSDTRKDATVPHQQKLWFHLLNSCLVVVTGNWVWSIIVKSSLI